MKGTANKSMIEITALNAAAGLIISGIVNDFHEAIPMALDSIKSGKSYNAFKDFIRFCGNIEKVEEFEKS